MTTRLAFALGLSCWILLSLPGCTGGLFRPKPAMTRLTIPDMNSAEEQYTYAIRYQQNSFPAGKPELRKDQRNQFRQLHQKVVNRYPNDMKHTPASYLLLADFDRDDGNLEKALEGYRKVQANYPQLEFIKARALFAEADVLDRQKRFEEAKAIHLRIMTDFANSTERGVPQIVQKARALYYTVRKDAPKRPLNTGPTRGSLSL